MAPVDARPSSAIWRIGAHSSLQVLAIAVLWCSEYRRLGLQAHRKGPASRELTFLPGSAWDPTHVRFSRCPRGAGASKSNLAPSALMRLPVPRASLSLGAPSGSLCPPLLYEVLPVVQGHGLIKWCWNWQEQLRGFNDGGPKLVVKNR